MCKRTLCLLTLLITLTGACRVLDVQTDPNATGIRSDALIEGYATFGFADDPSIVRVDVLDGPSRGGIFYFELWYLLRVELGLAGFAVGVGPLDFGIGTLFYHPRSPSADKPVDDDGEWHWHRPGVHVHVGGGEDDDCAGDHCELDHCDEPACVEARAQAAGEARAESPEEARADYVEELDEALEEQRAEESGTP